MLITTMGFMTTDPEHNKPMKCVCAKCGGVFKKGPWSGCYSKRGNHHYRYEKSEDMGLVVLCEKCASEELSSKRVGILMY